MNYEKRADIPEKYKWDTTVILPGGFQSAVQKANADIEAIGAFQGKLNNREDILKCFKYLDQISPNVEHLYFYAFIRQDLDSKDTAAQGEFSVAMGVYGRYMEGVAFIKPEVSSLSESELEKLIKDKDFKDYDRYLEVVLKSKAHVLSAAEEKIIAACYPIFKNFEETFNRLEGSDLDFGTVTVDGKEVKLTHGMYGKLASNPDQNVRRQNFETYYKPFISHVNTISCLYDSSVKADWFTAKLHKFSSSAAASLFAEEVDKSVYDNLVKSVNDNLKPLHEYIALRKDILGVETLNMYDLHCPLVEGADLKYDFEKAFELVKKGLEPLGEEYQKLLDKALAERWMDVYETPTKRSGAYNFGVYGTAHPYVLLNYQETTNDISTIAHELGHAMHSYLSSRNQPYMKGDYEIFVAEVASTCNEILLHRYLLGIVEDKGVKKYLLSTYLDMLRTTMYRQTMFAEFEGITHNMVENDIPLTTDSLCEKYLELNKKYYGDAVNHNEQIKYEWCRIPHFYRAFYVYKYATGIISAVCIADKILKEGKPAVDNYMKFLAGGRSADPVELLRIAGVDLSKPEPFATVAQSFRDTLNELKKLCK